MKSLKVKQNNLKRKEREILLLMNKISLLPGNCHHCGSCGGCGSN